MELLENTGINEYAIELVEGKKPPYGPIYAFNSVELGTLKVCIKTRLKTDIIQPFKSPTDALILFHKKLDGSLGLCIDYRGLSNLTIKN